jgi:hypothetical protein
MIVLYGALMDDDIVGWEYLAKPLNGSSRHILFGKIGWRAAVFAFVRQYEVRFRFFSFIQRGLESLCNGCKFM